MCKTLAVIAAAAIGWSMAGCSSLPSGMSMPNLLPANSPVKTGSIPKQTGPIGTPVMPTRPARMYVWAAFLEKDCSPVVTNVVVTKPPASGTVSFRDNQSTTIQHSLSGKCIGKTIAGKGVFYTANKGTDGEDWFEVTATSPSGQPVTKTFKVRIVDRIGG